MHFSFPPHLFSDPTEVPTPTTQPFLSPNHINRSGAVSKTVTAPLETLKMKLVQGGSVTVVEAARAVLASRGVGGFFAGNTIDVLRTVPSKALELAAFDSYKRTLRATPWVPDRAIGAVAGGLAGITSTVAIYPLETVRTRMAVNGHTFVQTLQRVGSHGGLPGLYRVSRQGEDEGGSEGPRGVGVQVGMPKSAPGRGILRRTCAAAALPGHPCACARKLMQGSPPHPLSPTVDCTAGFGCESDWHGALHGHPTGTVRRPQVLLEAGDREGAP